MSIYAHKYSNEVKKCGKFETMARHRFRKRFNIILKSNPNINIIEKLMVHSTTIPLDNIYFKPAIEQLFEGYQKVIPDLMIDDKHRL
tara:strand:+ start:276 stop:536 length:261 start_codon:yes stop_codon:yes gene_type:complete